MKIVFEQKKINKGTIKVSLDGGITYTNYEIKDVVETGIPLDDSQDLSKIKILGRLNVIQNLCVVSSTKRIKFTLDTNKHGPTFPYCVVGIEFQDGIISISKGASLSDYVNLTNINIPNSVTLIEEKAFYGCKSLKNINIPNSVTSIGEQAFLGCSSLTNINIPDSVIEIERRAFYGCSNLINVNISDNITFIPEACFRDCSSLTSIVIPSSVKNIGYDAFCYCTKLISVNISNGVTTIGEDAFYECSSLTNIVIPNSVTKIKDGAFSYCSNLATINYTGTKEQWEAITKSNGWNSGCPEDMQIIYNYQG